MPLSDALRLTLTQGTEREASLYLKPVDRNVAIRLDTTDLYCLEKVFIAEEYRSPFPASPRFIVDAGANIGMATLYFAKQFPEARIFAIEPELSNFDLLARNCENLPNVTLVQAALWCDRRPLMILNSSAEKYAFRIADKSSGSPSMVTIPAITVSDILHQTDAEGIDLLKLDIEGSELELFAENADQWLDRVKIIAIELHDRFKPGCAQAFYSALAPRKFVQEIRGENIFIRMLQH
jgi:FkbM family methyltransferase